ncbi:MAG: hypothetical protein AAGC67_22100 [Myxococcota bacterium]
MTFECATRGFPPPPDLVDFARVTTLFELWQPSGDPSRVAIDVRCDRADRPRFRCRIDVERAGRTVSAAAIAPDAYAAVRAAAAALPVPYADAGAAGEAGWRPVGLQSSPSPSVTHPCEAS